MSYLRYASVVFFNLLMMMKMLKICGQSTHLTHTHTHTHIYARTYVRPAPWSQYCECNLQCEYTVFESHYRLHGVCMWYEVPYHSESNGELLNMLLPSNRRQPSKVESELNAH